MKVLEYSECYQWVYPIELILLIPPIVLMAVFPDQRSSHMYHKHGEAVLDYGTEGKWREKPAGARSGSSGYVFYFVCVSSWVVVPKLAPRCLLGSRCKFHQG